METVRLIFHYYVRGFNASQTVREMNELIPSLTYESVIKTFSGIRMKIHVDMQNHFRRHKLGRYGNPVEIDESKFTHHTKGGRQTKLWVLGFYERGTRDVRAVVIKDRTEQTLTQIIREHCEEGAELYTDFWRGYNGLKHYFKHRIVNKAKKGKSTDEFCTTNRVESFWSNLKRIVFNYYMV